jgi:hypothetical protein
VNLRPVRPCQALPERSRAATRRGQWVNENLPTEINGGTDIGFNASISRIFPVTVGINTVYLNGKYNGYPGPEPYDCEQALWGPINMSATFVNQTPAATLTAP